MNNNDRTPDKRASTNTRIFTTAVGLVFVLLVAGVVAFWALTRHREEVAQREAPAVYETEQTVITEEEAVLERREQAGEGRVNGGQTQPGTVTRREVVRTQRETAVPGGSPQAPQTSPASSGQQAQSNNNHDDVYEADNHDDVDVIHNINLQTGGPRQPMTRVIRTAEEWQTFWADTVQQPPPVGFDPRHEVAAAIYTGQRDTGGYRVHIDSVRETNGTIRITYHLVAPRPDQAVSQVVTTPGRLLVLSKTNKRIEFRQGQTQQDPRPR